MGSGTSRGKRVAPACVSEVSVAKTASSVTSSKQDSRPVIPLKIHAVLRNVRNRAEPLDCHSEGHDSDSSGEDDEEVDTVVAEYDKTERNPPPKKVKSKTYGLCHFGRVDTEDDFGSAPQLRASERAEEPRGSRGGSKVINKRSNDAFTHFQKRTSDCTSPNKSSKKGFMPKGPLLEAVPTSEKQSCHSPSLTMPVILYDGSEEELMDTIEREFR